jgi:hypothetical protein
MAIVDVFPGAAIVPQDGAIEALQIVLRARSHSSALE